MTILTSKKMTIMISGILLMSLISCGNTDKSFDATGSFEAIEIIVSSEAAGRVDILNIEEGSQLKIGQDIGLIDTVQLSLKRDQLEAQIEALHASLPNIPVQLSPLKTQLKTAENEYQRITNLAKSNAATSKQVDDITAQVSILKAQLQATQSTLNSNLNSAKKNIDALEIQLAQVHDHLSKCYLKSNVDGTILTLYTRENELTAPGKPLYKIADLSSLILRAYISGDQLPQIKLNQTVTVSTDDGDGGLAKTEGVITWISDKSEFTPKSIQTKNERASRVYAIKIKVKNDGRLKIGMYGEVNF